MPHFLPFTRLSYTAPCRGFSPFIPGFALLQQNWAGHCAGPVRAPTDRQRASAFAAVDRRYGSDALIFADLSNDATYAEVLFENFGPRVIGLHICRSGDGNSFERRPVKGGSILVYTIGRTYLLELFHTDWNPIWSGSLTVR